MISLTQVQARVTIEVPKPMTWSFRASPCFLAHEEPDAPAPKQETQSFCSHYIMEVLHTLCPHILVSCRHNWFILTCLSKNYIEGKCKFTKCPAGSDMTVEIHDCGFSLQASGSHIFGFMVWNEEGKMKNCDWQVCKQGHGKVLQWRTENDIFYWNASLQLLLLSYFWSYCWLRPHSHDI